jgi:hypothetical protein
MVGKWFKTLAKVPLAALMSLGVMSPYIVEESLAVSVTQSPTPAISPSPATQPSNGQSQQIWSCSASSRERTYVVDQLSLDINNFDMAIYETSRGDDGDYIGTTQVNVTQKAPELVGHGQTFNSTFEVNAFGRTVAFNVQDSVAGQASGRCDAQWQMADGKTRRLVRQCLALVARRLNGVPEVARFGCTSNPNSYIEELQRQ